MTMRLDIVTNDAGELVRREHARDLGAGVVVAIYRLAKLAQMHDLTNQAFLRQLDDTQALIQDYGLRSGSNVNILFAKRAVFVAGQLLKGSRSTYEMASELGEIIEWCGGAELSIARDLTQEELRAFAEALSQATRGERGKFRSPSAKIRLRPVADAARLRGLELEDLSFEQRIVRAYASAVVIIRRFFEDLAEGRYILPRRVKRIAQTLVDLSEGSTPAFLGVTEARNANHDEAGRAVNSAILAVAIAREMTDERALLAQIAMAAIMHDVGRPRAIALAASQGPAMTGVVARLSEEAEDKLPAGTAAVLTALGRVNEATVTRTVVSYEALWLRRGAFLGPLYRGVRSPTLQARIVAIARRYNDLLTPEPGLAPPHADTAVATLWDELKSPGDRAVLRMLVAALGTYPAGTVVQLTTKEIGEVVGSRDTRALLDKPRVRLVIDANGGLIDRPYEIDLAVKPKKGETARAIERVVSVDGWRKGKDAAPAEDSDVRAADHDAEALAAIASQPSVEPDLPSSQSLGTSPSQVAEAFARHMLEPAQAPAPTPPAPREERTVFQPPQFDGAPGADKPAAPSTPSGARAALAASPPTAQGAIAATPLVHVLVYILDHGLSGTVVFDDPEGVESYVYFYEGAPAKARLGRPVALLGEELARVGAIDREVLEKAIESAKKLGLLLGEYLVGHKLLAEDVLRTALADQLRRKLASLVNLPPETRYAFYRDVNALDTWGASALTPCHPLDAILGCVREWHDRARVHATLGRLGKQPLVLHADVDFATLSLRDEEAVVLAIIRGESPPLSALLQMNVADEDTVGSLVYTLAVTRQFAFAKGPPMGRASKDASPPPIDRESYLPMTAVVEPPGSPAPPFAASIAPPPEPAPIEAAEDAPPPARHEPDEALEIRAMTDFRDAEAALAQSDIKQAELLALRAVEADPRPDHVAFLAWVRAARAVSAAATADAIAELTKLLDKAPGFERALLYRGKLLKRANRIKEALRDFETVLRANPQQSEAASEARLLRARLGIRQTGA
jgi:HD-GYP domain-containing protein (c-di-GMP phosphodiesterase class II)